VELYIRIRHKRNYQPIVFVKYRLYGISLNDFEANLSFHCNLV
jgi:hypothetical protein